MYKLILFSVSFLLVFSACQNDEEKDAIEIQDSPAEKAIETTPQQQPEQQENQEQNVPLKQAEKEIAETKKKVPVNTHMWNESIEFYASGNEPSWNLLLNLESGITFSRPGEDDIIVPPVEPELAQDADILRFRTTNGITELILSLTTDPLCNDNMSSNAYDASVRIEIKNEGESSYTTYTGCGRYSIHPELFETGWKLVSLNDKPAEESKYQRGAPIVTFREFDRGFGGHDGCNDIGGRYTIRVDKLSFSSFASTALSCPNMKESREFNIAAQGETFSYVIYDEILTLSSFKGTMVFIKYSDN